MTDKDKQVDLLPCPFCGSKIDTEECPYPSGGTWRYFADGEKEYGSHRQFENQCLNIVCQCGAVLLGDTEDELITLWNTRPRARESMMNHKERSHLIKQVIDAAKSHAKCENLHHKKSHQHLDGWICPAESELEAAIYKVGLMLQKGEHDGKTI